MWMSTHNTLMLTCTLILLSVAAATALRTAPRDKPNIVFVMTDDEDLLLGGASNRPLPVAADALRAAGTTLTNHFVHTPVRAALVFCYLCFFIDINIFESEYSSRFSQLFCCSPHPSQEEDCGTRRRSDIQCVCQCANTHHPSNLRFAMCMIKVCCPSRSEVLTGRYFHNLMWNPPSDRWDTVDGVHSRQCMHIDESKLSPGPTFAEHLANVGYKVVSSQRRLHRSACNAFDVSRRCSCCMPSVSWIDPPLTTHSRAHRRPTLFLSPHADRYCLLASI